MQHQALITFLCVNALPKFAKMLAQLSKKKRGEDVCRWAKMD